MQVFKFFILLRISAREKTKKPHVLHLSEDAFHRILSTVRLN